MKYHLKQVGESEKAVQFRANFACTDGTVARQSKVRRWTFWCPKSVLVDGQPPRWILEREDAKACDFYGFEQGFGLDLHDAACQEIW